MIGLHLSQYRIDAELGRGGMGIVYRATDTKLDRTVAIKVLPPHALSSEDDRARFNREAKAAAQLHHPNIATVFQVDEAEVEGTLRPFIAMEFIEGESLGARIAKGPLKLEEAVSIATQIAEALRAAHARDIVHRDIKSQNVMLTRDGVAKVLDFGLAKTSASTQLTRQGSTMGTVAYMSPEQARGEEVDGRSDLYSLGNMFYEMIAGRLPFGADYEQAIVYAILNEDPEPLTALRTGVPMEVERIAAKLLEKDRTLRYQSAADLIADLRRLDVRGPARSVTQRSAAAMPTATAASRRWQIPSWALAVAFALGAGLAWFALGLRADRSTAPSAVYRFDAIMPTREKITDVSISGDGMTLAYTGSGADDDFVYIHDLRTGESRALEGSDGATIVELSDDGSEILITTALGVFLSSTKVGSPVAVLMSEENSPRANWGPGSKVIFEDENRVFVLDRATKSRYPVILDDTTAVQDLDWPSMLPDGRTLMATIEYRGLERGLGFWDVETGRELGRLQQGGYRARYVPTGHLVMVVGSSTQPGNLVALPFDVSSLKPTGPLVPLVSGVLAEAVAVSRTGTLVYGFVEVPGVFQKARLEVVSVDGRTRRLDFEPAIFNSIKLSPTGDKAVVSVVDAEATARQADALETYVFDLSTGNRLPITRSLTGGAADWLSGADSVLYVDNTQRFRGETRVMVRAADGSGEVREVFRSTSGIHDVDVSPDGTMVAYAEGLTPFGATEIEVRSMRTGEVTSLAAGTPAVRRFPTFSSDGARVMYLEDNRLLYRASDGTGVANLFPLEGTRMAWAAASGRVFAYGERSQTIAYHDDGGLRGAIPVPGRIWAMDAFPGGDALLTAVEVAGSGEGTAVAAADSLRSLHVVLNLLEELK